LEAALIQIRRALVSVSDKSGLAELAHYLHDSNVEILSTGGTAKYLRGEGIAVVEVSDFTGFPEVFDGRVKTLHPKIHGGLLAIRSNPAHQEQMQLHGIRPIDMVVVNLYPFREAAARGGSTFPEVVEQIDIGGPSMIRSAAKNSDSVAVVTDPRDYAWILQELQANGCSLSAATKFILAQKAFACTASYDGAIAAYFSERVWSPKGPVKVEVGMPHLDIISLEKVKDLRYGENPHQRAALYARVSQPPVGVAGAEVLHGKELSYNNLLDSDAAWNLVCEFDRTAAVIIKHNNPCGVAQADTLCAAYVMARECDPVSAFGSVIAFNRKVEDDTATEIASTFVEVVLAPEYSEKALEILKTKKNLRLLRMSLKSAYALEHREISGGFLLQDRDLHYLRPDQLKLVTRRAPTATEMEAFMFGWRVVKHVKSNAIVLCDTTRTLGVGAGQMNRVDSVRLASQRAVLPLEGCVMASDAFFPFPDGIIAAAGAGVKAVIQPGGSLKDAEAIEAADAHDMAMVFTGIRHFRH
jgi:phosphoribosylaminoimidazolecarboxamide formyltransferase / IMP cyclohydrolase